jgi:glycosyltransferase involved in cell wall biosynthesis
MASGLPVVATRCGGPEEMVKDGEEGWLAERGSAGSVADALERLIGDPLARRRMGSAARHAAVSRFSTAAMINKYETLYEGLARRGRPVSAAKPALRAMEHREEPAGKQ